ncbi:MAG: VOC family protein [Candidatus Eisenbacteria bacterium]|uniref:VOC family protein n=1 Tax=Eiseniibacteriota bacterium TaxID=2212470 RepID=A0A849SSK3_UNCEI|nr:VOC family protein [Candidatus Eisenbacteria bacterium]
MSAARLDPRTRVGSVHLRVREPDVAAAFYRERLGLVDRSGDAATVRLGTADAELLVLHGDPAAVPAPGTTGLYHFAILVPSRADLARSLARLAETRTPLQGASDHGVSEALYLVDPERNGIEIYRDREVSEWPRTSAGLAMKTDPLDLDALVLERGDPALPVMPAGTRIGHVHLHVSELPRAERFYCDVLGFDLMQRLGHSAAFVSAGGYHHHVGLNTWAGDGAPPPPSGAAGLAHFELRVSDEAAVAVARARLGAAKVATETIGAGIAFWDPFGHRVELLTEPR